MGSASLELKSKEEKDAELDRRIEALRRKNEALIKRYQEIEEDRKKAEQEGVAVTGARRPRSSEGDRPERRRGEQGRRSLAPSVTLSETGYWAGWSMGLTLYVCFPPPQEWEERRRQNIEKMNEEMEQIAEYERSQRDGLQEKNPVRSFLDDPRRSGPFAESDRRDGSRRHIRNWGGPDFDKVRTGLERGKDQPTPVRGWAPRTVGVGAASVSPDPGASRSMHDNRWEKEEPAPAEGSEPSPEEEAEASQVCCLPPWEDEDQWEDVEEEEEEGGSASSGSSSQDVSGEEDVPPPACSPKQQRPPRPTQDALPKLTMPLPGRVPGVQGKPLSPFSPAEGYQPVPDWGEEMELSSPRAGPTESLPPRQGGGILGSSGRNSGGGGALIRGCWTVGRG
uniref:Coiled-coil domain containing 9 n=1 Tax=Sphenodon punctatus TaxID=8508 RepID=A0A8D0L8T8_SPHPU